MNTQAKLFPRWRGGRTALAVIKLTLAGLLTAAALAVPAQAADTVVSLTFDDGLTQSLARNLLAKHGMKGTFYVNSDRIGDGGYLTKAELDALYADGNEIGGHTIGHVNLASLSDAAQQAAICDDMQNLVNWGYQAYSFAYPYGSTGPASQNILKAGCPGVGTYESARTVGGLVTGTSCSGCPWSNATPPVNPYFVATSSSIVATTPLATIQGYVTQAETHGGGWVPLVFHRICSNCDTYSMTEATLDAFLTWLEARQSQNTYVRTVHEVMSGGGGTPPPPPPPPPPSANLLINPSLEIDANNNGQPDCWSRSSYGSNSATWTRTSDAHDGSFAQQLKISSFSSGDRKLLPTLDAGQPGGCAPVVVPGQTYELSAWYKSTVPATTLLFYLDANNVWRYWAESPALSASSSWKQMTYQTAPVPAGAKALSFGVGLERVGTLVTDDYSLSLAVATPPLPPPSASNLLINPSLEIDGNNDGQPDCWARDDYGTNSAVWTRTGDAHTGSFAQQLDMVSFSSGDRKLLPTLDVGQPSGCAPLVEAGESYKLSAWYKSTVPATTLLFYLDANNVWQYWLDGPALSASSSWKQMTYQTPSVPAGAKAISFGVGLERVGTLVTDDYAMTLAP